MPLFNFIKHLLIQFHQGVMKTFQYKDYVNPILLLKKFKAHPRRMDEELLLFSNTRRITTEYFTSEKHAQVFQA